MNSSVLVDGTRRVACAMANRFSLSFYKSFAPPPLFSTSDTSGNPSHPHPKGGTRTLNKLGDRGRGGGYYTLFSCALSFLLRAAFCRGWSTGNIDGSGGKDKGGGGGDSRGQEREGEETPRNKKECAPATYICTNKKLLNLTRASTQHATHRGILNRRGPQAVRQESELSTRRASCGNVTSTPSSQP